MEAPSPIKVETPRENLIDIKMIDTNIFDFNLNNKKFQFEFGKSEKKNIIFKVKEINDIITNNLYLLNLNINEFHRINVIFTLYQTIDEIYAFLLDIIRGQKYSFVYKENKIILILQIPMSRWKNYRY